MTGKLFLSSASVGFAAALVAQLWVQDPIWCDYDIAGLLLHLDGGAPVRDYLPNSKLLIAPVVSSFGELVQVFGHTRFVEVWAVLAVCAITASAVIVFWICYRVSGRLSAAAAGTAVFVLSGSTSYLARVLEDNLLTTVCLSLLILALVPTPHPPRLNRFALAGAALATSVLLGFGSAAWVVFPIAMAFFAGAPTWRGRLGGSAVAGAVGLAVFLMAATVLTPPAQPPPINPLSHFAGGFPQAGMFAAAHPLSVRLRYIASGSYYALSPLPADINIEWGASPLIAAGQLPGIWLHLLCLVAMGLLAFLAIRVSPPTSATRAFAMACASTLVGLTLVNLSAVDGSFVERFDYVPLLLGPLVAIAFVARGPFRLAARVTAVTVAVAVTATTLTYTVMVRSTGAGRWQYADMRDLAAMREPQEAVVLGGTMQDYYDYDPLSLSAGLWLGRSNVYLIPSNATPFVGYYAIAPLAGLEDSVRLREWFEVTLASRSALILNEESLKTLAPFVDSVHWQLDRLPVGKRPYYRARRIGS